MGLIHGVVRGAGGEPVPEARAFFVSGPEPFPDIAAVTDGEGRFTLSAPSRGTYTLECVAEGFVREAVRVDLEGDEESHIEVTLRSEP